MMRAAAPWLSVIRSTARASVVAGTPWSSTRAMAVIARSARRLSGPADRNRISESPAWSAVDSKRVRFPPCRFPAIRRRLEVLDRDLAGGQLMGRPVMEGGVHGQPATVPRAKALREAASALARLKRPVAPLAPVGIGRHRRLVGNALTVLARSMRARRVSLARSR